MADRIRKKIIKNLETDLGLVTSIKTVSFGTIEPEDPVNKPTLPIAAIIPLMDTPEAAAKSVSRNKLRVIVRFIVDKDNESAGYELEDVMADGLAKIMADPHRGGNARNTRWVSDTWLYLDRDRPQAGADTELEIDYATKIEDPTAAPA